ncbi:MAG: protein kinase [Pirellulales bacterium]
MSEYSAEKLAHFAYDLGLIDERQLDQLRSELGSGAGTSDDFRRAALRRELLTNFQIDRLLKKERSGYFYGDYKVLYLVGTGTFARVYRATHKKTGKIFAVKVLRKRFRDDAQQMELFLREGEVGLLLRHPNIVPVYELNTDPVSPYFVMDFVEGQNLREFVKVRRKLDVPDAVRLMVDIMSGLAYAAQQGIFHRDLKLSNVLVTSRGTARLVDFGLYGTRATDDTAAETPNARTIDYVALERTTGVRKNDPRSDIFFAGGMLYHMLAGVAALPEARERSQRLSATRYREIKPILEVEPDLPKSVASVVTKAMELSPDKRYQNPAEMLADLQAVSKRLDSPDASETGKTVAPPIISVPSAPPPPPVEQEGANHTVMIVESHAELQNVLRDKLKKHGYRVLVISDPQRALDRFKEDTPPAECVLFSASFLGEPAVEAFNRFGDAEQTRKMPAILLVDEHQGALTTLAQLAPHRVLLKMPLKVREVRQALKQLLGIGAASK